jgi:hypothetical protein
MTLSLTNSVLVTQASRSESRRAKTQLFLKQLYSYLAQHKGSPDLQIVNFSALTSASVVVADVPCKLYALFLKKPTGSTVSVYAKATDDELTASVGTNSITQILPVAVEETLIYPDGLAFAAGIVMRADTSPIAAGAPNAADRPSGFAIIGGA